jgi:soluble lytic murein transglycosylase
MQVMPGTGREVARRLGMPWSSRKLTEPEYNLRLGTAYFRQVLTMFDGDVELALAGYNGGPYRIQRLWREARGAHEIDSFLEGLDIPESRTYVKRILLLADSYQQLYFAGAG